MRADLLKPLVYTVQRSQHSVEGFCRLNLFWILFVIDKSVSPAFGRPVALPGTFYSNVMVPSIEALSAFNPHIHLAVDTQSSESCRSRHPSRYGALHFLNSLKLAKLMERVYILIQSQQGDEKVPLHELSVELNNWFEEALSVRTNPQFFPHHSAHESVGVVRRKERRSHILRIEAA